MQWNFFIQRELMNDLSLDIGYVGSGSRKQIGYSPFNNALTPGPGAIQPRRLLPQFGDLDGGSNQYNGSYNGLQVTLRKRYSNGLQFNTNYTWQKSLDGQSSLAESGKTQDPFNRRADYSRSTWDINHVFNFAYLYELPFGNSRKWGANWAKATDLVLGGWSVEGITRLRPDRRLMSAWASIGPIPVVRPNAPIWSAILTPARRTVDQWFNTAAFAMPAEYTFGNAGAYITNADGLVSIDMAVAKNFPIRGSHALEFRTEFFNVPNTVNFSDPISVMNNANFGRITSQRTPPRQIQFSLRYRF